MSMMIALSLVLVSCGNDDDAPSALSVPAGGSAEAISDQGFTLRFGTVSTADGYEIDISKTEDFSSFVPGYSAKQLTKNELIVTGLDPSTTYYFRVRSVRGEEKSEYGAVNSVTTGTAGFDSITLKGKASFPIGNIIQSNRIEGKHKEILETHFNHITSEYEMKMTEIWKGPNDYDFEAADKTLDFADLIGADVHGHALVWHTTIPGWLNDFDGTDAEFEQLIKDYILAVVGRYKGRIRSWDVVNEIFEENGTLRNSIFRLRMGDDFAKKCHEWTKQADPDVLLFYNDYSFYFNEPKLDAAIALAEDLGSLIDGIGFQMHTNTGINILMVHACISSPLIYELDQV